MPIDPAKLNSLLDEQDGAQARQASLGASVSPDDMGRALSIADKRQQPPMVVAQNLPDFDEREHLDAVQDAASKSPMLGRWFQKPEHAALAKDDLPQIGLLAASIKNLFPFLPNQQERITRIGEHLKAGVEQPIGGLMQEAGDVIGAPFQYLRSVMMNARTPAVIPLFGANRPYADATDALARKGADIYDLGQATSAAASLGVTRPASLADAIRRPGNTFDYYGGMLAESLPLVGATSLGGPTAGVLAAGVGTAGQSYGQYRAEGEAVDTALSASTTQGFIEGAFERLPLAEAFKPGGSFLRRFLRTTAAESVSEGATQAAQDQAEASDLGREISPAQRLANIIDATIVGAGMAGPIAVRGAAAEIAREQADADRKSALDAINLLANVEQSGQAAVSLGKFTQAAADAKLGKRAPAAVEALVGDAGTAYVPAEAVRTLYQGSDPHAFVASLTGDADALNIAGQHGDIAIPLAKWASVIARQPNAEEWVKHARTDPEGYSRADLESIDLDAELQSQPQEQASTEGTDKIREDVLGQLLASDRYSPEEAELQASLVAKTFGTLAQRSGTDPLELYQRYNLRVNGKPESLLQKATGKAKALLQAAFHGTPHEVERFSLHKIGTGEGAQAFGWGLYFASLKEVAKSYRDKLSGVILDGAPVNEGSLAGSDTSMVAMFKNRLVAGLSVPNARAQTAEWAKGNRFISEYRSEPQIDEFVGRLDKHTGNLYRVEVPEDSDLLDFEKPMSQQPEVVRAAARKVWDALPEWFKDEVFDNANADFDELTGNEFYQVLSKFADEGGLPGQFEHPEATQRSVDGREAASHALFVAGIPGLRYLDGNSRSARDGSHNYVVWDEAAIGPPERVLDQPADGGAPRGQLRIGADRSMSIDLLKGADLSTFLHETGHLALEVFGDLAKSKNADPQLKADFDTLREWFGNTGEPITTEQHEAFAEAFEQYLLEGKAPAPDLQSAFSRFRAWLLSIYRNMVKMRVPLTDEVRSVFDRIIATDEEIQAAQQAQGMGPLELTDEAKALLTPGQWEAYIAATVDATEEAKRDVLQKLMASHKRAAERWYKDERAKVKAEIEAEVELAPTVRAWRILAGARSVAGVETPEALRTLKLDPEQVLPDDRKAIAGMGVTKRGGVSPETAAALLGFDSGDALVQALKGVRDLQAQVEMETDDRMEQRHPDAIASVADEALDAVHRNKRVQVLEAELTMLARLANKPRPNHRALRAVAERTIAAKTIRKLRPNDYLVAERKAANAAARAAAKGDYAEALQAKRDQAIQSALYTMARRAQRRAESQSRALRKAGSDKTRKRVGKSGKSYVEALDALLSTHELRRVSGVAVARREALRAWVAKRQELGDNTAVSDDLLARVEAERVTNIEDLTVKELGDLHEAVRNLLHLARVKNRLQTSAGQVSWRKAKALLIERLEAQPGKHGGGIGPTDTAMLDKLREFGGAVGNWVLQPETIVEWLDGGVSGPFHDLLWEPSEAAEHKREALQRMVGAKLKEAFDALPKADRKALDDKVYIRSLGESVSGHSILSALLNMGSASNRDKLLRGGRVSGDGIAPFAPEQLGEMFSRLTAAQANLAQGVWDAVNSLWPEIVTMEESLNGIAPAKVEPLPVTITTKDGPVSLRGGYFPAKYDPRGAKVGRFADDEHAKRMLSGQIPIKASTSKGHLEKRTEYTAPLLLDYHAVLSQHLDGVMSDIAYRGFLKQAYRVLDDADLARRVENRLGHSALKALKAGFERGAVGSFSLAGPLWGPFQGVADATMTNVSSAALGLRVPLALANTVTAPILATARVQKRHLIAAFGSYYRDMRGSQAMIHALSPMMVRRSEARTIELQSILANLRGKSGARKQMIELAMSVHQWIVPLAENAIWMAAYRQAQAGGADITESVRLADKAIRQTQTKHTAKDLSLAEGNPYLRWAMMFAGPMVVINNRLQESGLRGKFRGAVHTPVDALGAWIAMAAGGSLVFELIMGRGPGDEDDDGEEGTIKDWAEWCARKVALLPFAAYPVLRDVADKLDHGFVRANPLVEAGNSLLQFGKTAIKSGEALFSGDDVDEAKLTKDTIKAAGVATGIPTNQLVRSGTYLMEVGTGQHTPKNPAAEAAYLMQGPPRD